MVLRRTSTDIQYINVLRILAIFAVINVHVSSGMTDNITPLTFNWWLGNFVHVMTLWSIPVFVMVSGALLLDGSRNETPAYFYKKRAQRIGVPLVFWTFFYLVVRKIVGHKVVGHEVVGPEELTAGYVIKLILTAEPYYHLWFLYMIAGLYLVTPLLRTYIKHSSSKERISLIAMILILASSYSLINSLLLGNERSIFTIFIPYIGFYLCGYQLRFIDLRKISLKYLAAVLTLCLIYIAMLTDVFIRTSGQPDGRFLYDSFSPPVIVMSIAVFWTVYLISRHAKPLKGLVKAAAERLAAATLGIYVLHPVLLEYIRDRLGKHSTDGNFLLGLAVVPVITFIGCYLITSLIMRIPLLRRVVC
jgi:surface polysaccharide O-acyltransferase-like enzyme